MATYGDLETHLFGHQKLELRYYHNCKYSNSTLWTQGQLKFSQPRLPKWGETICVIRLHLLLPLLVRLGPWCNHMLPMHVEPKLILNLLSH